MYGPTGRGAAAEILVVFPSQTGSNGERLTRSVKKPYAVVISAGNDGTGALAHIERVCKGYRFKKVQHPIVCNGPVTDGMREECHNLGRTIAEGVRIAIF